MEVFGISLSMPYQSNMDQKMSYQEFVRLILNSLVLEGKISQQSADQVSKLIMSKYPYQAINRADAALILDTALQ